MNIKKAITEEMGEHKQWYEEARTVTPATIDDFMNRLIYNYQHDYGTVVHAMACCALAAVHAFDKSEQGGITGFQAGAVVWQFIEGWMGESRVGRQLLDLEDMLYPQNEEQFTTISPRAFALLQDEARKILTDGNGSEYVRQHLESIVAGTVPFGRRLSAGESEEARGEGDTKAPE